MIKIKKRLQDAVDNGLKAVKWKFSNDEDFNDDMRYWFVFNDDTTGLTTISDMVNQGYSKEKILKTINDAHDVLT